MALAGLMTKEEAEEVLGAYADTLLETYHSSMAAKFGLRSYDRDLSAGLMTLMYEDSADFTNTFRALSSVSAEGGDEIPGQLQQVISNVHYV